MPRWCQITFFDLFPPYVFPCATCLTFFVTCTVTYAVALSYGHISGVSYISDTGTKPPESCIFGLFLSIYAVFLGISVWNVYIALPSPTALQGWICAIGILAAFGVEIVANFQETVVFFVHMTGAMTAFGWATVYMWLTLYSSPHARLLRLCLTLIATASLIITSVTGMISFRLFKGNDIINWSSDDPGYTMHVASVVSEWTLAVSVNLFISTLSYDIKGDDELTPLLGNQPNEATRGGQSTETPLGRPNPTREAGHQAVACKHRDSGALTAAVAGHQAQQKVDPAKPGKHSKRTNGEVVVDLETSRAGGREQQI